MRLTEVSSEVVVWRPEVEGLREATEQGLRNDVVSLVAGIPSSEEHHHHEHGENEQVEELVDTHVP